MIKLYLFPGIYYQLFTVHILEKGACVPRIFGLLPDKTETTYLRFFKAVKVLAPGFSPESVMLDFEKAGIFSM